MAGTVDASAVSTVTLAETGDAAKWDDIGGGPGSGQSIDQPIQGSENRSRRIDNVVRGFSYDNATGIDISATGTHVGWWVNVFQPGLIQSGGIEFILGGGATPTTSPWAGWTFAGSSYPITGGWIRVWLDPTISNDTGPGSLSLSSIRQFGGEFDMGDIDGTSDSCHIDYISYTGSGLLVDSGTAGSPATFSDFSTFEGSNRVGVLINRDGVNFVLARLTIGDATATVFNDSGFQIVFPNPPKTAGSVPFVSTTFMGISVDLQTASTDVDFSQGIIKSAGPDPLTDRQGDFIVTGTAGAFDANGTTFDTLRAVMLTSKCTLASCLILGCGQITLDGANIATSTITNSIASAAALWNTNADPNGELDNTTWNRNSAEEDTNHALQFDSNTPQTITLTGHSYTGYHSQAAPSSPITFDTETGINSGTDIVTVDQAGHEYSTGEPVWVQDQGGTETPGLSDSTRYFVNAQSTTTLSFHTTKANADADTSRVNLTASGAGNGETWELYSGFATIYNNNGTMTINVTNGDTPSIRNGDGASTTVNNTVTLTVKVIGSDGQPHENARVAIYDSGGAQLMNELTTAAGIATESYSYVSDETVSVRVRDSSDGTPHKPVNQTQTITSGGLDITVTLASDDIITI